MSAPAIHIILGKKIYDKYCSDKNEADFIRGTSFADIRYTAKLDRNSTHFKSVTLEEIISANSFMAGLLTHSLVDLSRAQFVRDNGMIETLPESKYIGQAVKCYEDSLLYNKLSHQQWQAYVNYFKEYSDEEFTYNIPQEILERWHLSIINSIKQLPHKKNIINFMTFVGSIDAEDEINRIFPLLEQNTKIKDTIFSYYKNFDQIVTDNY